MSPFEIFSPMKLFYHLQKSTSSNRPEAFIVVAYMWRIKNLINHIFGCGGGGLQVDEGL